MKQKKKIMSVGFSLSLRRKSSSGNGVEERGAYLSDLKDQRVEIDEEETMMMEVIQGDVLVVAIANQFLLS